MNLFIDYDKNQLIEIDSTLKGNHIIQYYYSFGNDTTESARSYMLRRAIKKDITLMLLEHKGIVFDLNFESCYINAESEELVGDASLMKDFLKTRTLAVNKVMLLSHITLNQTSTTFTGIYLEKSELATIHRKQAIDSFLFENA